MENNEIAIKVTELGKKYTIGSKKEDNLRASLKNLFNFNSYKVNSFWALRNLNFEIKKGDVVGIVGKNGAGKSTLLKLLSQITKPTEGRIEINDRVASLLEVGTGFHQELTGRENIYLNGTILGMTRKEVKEKFDEIVDFSGVEKFIETPVKHYSSGMYVRLAFAVAAHLEPEILIIDEVLAVGDSEFQKKCLGKMRDVAKQGRTVLFVSHNMAAVRALCNKGIFLSQGNLLFEGSANETIERSLLSDDSSGVYQPKFIKEHIEVAFKKIEVLTAYNVSCSNFTCDDIIQLKFSFEIREEKHPYNLFVIIKDQFGSPVFSAERKIHANEISLLIANNFLTRGNYCIHTFIHIPKIKQVDVAEDVCRFAITDASSPMAIHDDYNYGNVFGNIQWK